MHVKMSYPHESCVVPVTIYVIKGSPRESVSLARAPRPPRAGGAPRAQRPGQPGPARVQCVFSIPSKHSLINQHYAAPAQPRLIHTWGSCTQDPPGGDVTRS